MPTTETAKYFEDLQEGDVFQTEPRRTNERDLLFAALWDGDGQPHSNEEYSKRTPWGTRILHGDATLGLGAGLVHGLGIFDGTMAGCDGMSIRYPGPVDVGDSISATLTIEKLERLETSSNGRVTARLAIHNENKDAVAVDATVHYLIKRRP